MQYIVKLSHSEKDKKKPPNIFYLNDTERIVGIEKIVKC
jgi:hypothetical protein